MRESLLEAVCFVAYYVILIGILLGWVHYRLRRK